MAVKTFPGAKIGMDNQSDNREYFYEYVDAYFPGIQGITTISLLYKSDYTAVVIASTSDGDLTVNMPLDKDDVQKMLSGLTRKLNVMGIRWKSIGIDIQWSGRVMVNVNW